MSECVRYKDGLTITWTGPTKVLRTERGEPRWCFGCRKRLGGTHKLTGDVEPSYYDPNWSYSCDGCGEDRRAGFGGTWEYDE